VYSLVSNVSDTCVASNVISETVTNENFVENCVHQTFPNSRNNKQWLQRLNENEWLMIQNGILGSKTCRNVGSWVIHNTQRQKLCTEWKECTVSSFGDNDEKRRQSIRNKMLDHKNSVAHQSCITLQSKSKEEKLQKAISTEEAVYHKLTSRVFVLERTSAELWARFSA
jgi:hypothetical protein